MKSHWTTKRDAIACLLLSIIVGITVGRGVWALIVDLIGFLGL